MKKIIEFIKEYGYPIIIFTAVITSIIALL